MGKQFISEAELIRLTTENVRSFYHRQKEDTTALMTDDFMWIGSNDFQWCEGLEEFLRITKKEYDEPAVRLSDEEYHLLLHDHNVWVVYGRYKATIVLEDDSIIHAHVRGTYVWKKVNGKLRLAHVHGSHAQDIPLNHSSLPREPLTESSAFFNYMKQMDTLNVDADKLSIRGRHGTFYYPHASDILYLKAEKQGCIIYTKTDNYEAVGILAVQMKHLPSHFMRIHKSYVVNLSFISTICRYKATLTDGQRIPISKTRYMELKNKLSLYNSNP